MEAITLSAVLFVLFAGLVAAIVRSRDVPVTTVEIKPFLITLASSIIAAAIVTWMLVDANGSGDTDAWDSIVTFPNFLVIAGTAVGGMSFITSIINILPGQTPPVPATTVTQTSQNTSTDSGPDDDRSNVTEQQDTTVTVTKNK